MSGLLPTTWPLTQLSGGCIAWTSATKDISSLLSLTVCSNLLHWKWMHFHNFESTPQNASHCWYCWCHVSSTRVLMVLFTRSQPGCSRIMFTSCPRLSTILRTVGQVAWCYTAHTSTVTLTLPTMHCASLYHDLHFMLNSNLRQRPKCKSFSASISVYSIMALNKSCHIMTLYWCSHYTYIVYL